jgi:hypothetical protein
LNDVAKQGGKLSYSPAYTPEINSTVELINRTVWEGAYLMLLASNLTSVFWVIAVIYFVIIYNFLPTNTLKERMSPCKPAMAHINTSQGLRFLGVMRTWTCIAEGDYETPLWRTKAY